MVSKFIQKHKSAQVFTWDIGELWSLIPKLKLAKNCNIAQGVTIAQANRGRNEGVPEIGDEVWIGPNAVIVGKIKIGNNVLIAPNAYVEF
jgi:Serine acetyltransferase